MWLKSKKNNSTSMYLYTQDRHQIHNTGQLICEISMENQMIDGSNQCRKKAHTFTETLAQASWKCDCTH